MQRYEQQPIYLDGHATTPLAPEAERAMAPWWHLNVGNAHSPHVRGLRAAAAVENSRKAIANLAQVSPSEIAFTSGATEANNLAIFGIARAARNRGDQRRRIVVSAVEHGSVLGPARALEREGYELVLAPVDSNGVINLDALARLMTPDTLMVSAMAANNEVGSIQPIMEVAAIAREVGSIIHVDAAQAFGKVPIDFGLFDLVSISAHKLYGPGGVGALFHSAASDLRPAPIVYGGDQEGGLRSGTLPVPLIVGFGAAACLALERMNEDAEHAQSLSARFISNLRRAGLRFRVNGTQDRIPGSLSIQIDGADAACLIDELSPRVCLSDGSACSSGSITHSHVLDAMQLSPKEMSSTIRIFFSRYNSEADADLAASAISDTVLKAAA